MEASLAALVNPRLPDATRTYDPSDQDRLRRTIEQAFSRLTQPGQTFTMAGWLHINNKGQLGEGNQTDPRSAVVFGANDDVEAWFIGPTTDDTKANTVLGAFSWQLNNWLQYWKASGEVDFPVGPVVIGTDPGGTNELRIGGAIYASTGGTLGGVTVIVGDPGLGGALRINNTLGSVAVAIAGDTGAAWPAASIYFKDTAAASTRQFAFGARAGAISLSDETAGAVRMTMDSNGHWVFTGVTSTTILQVRDNSAGGTVSIGSDGTGQTHIAMGSSGTIDGQSGQFQLRGFGTTIPVAIYTNSTQRMIVNADGTVVIGTDPGGSGSLRVGGNVDLASSGKIFFGTAATDYALRANAGSPVALEVVAGDESVYADFRAHTIYATNGFSGDGSALTGIPSHLSLLADSVSRSSTANAETTLSSLTLPAGSLATNGDLVRIRAWGDMASTGSGVAEVILYFGTKAIATFSGSGSTAIWYLEATVMRSGATTQKAAAVVARGLALVLNTNTTATETLSSAVTIKTTGQNTTGLNTVTLNNYGMEVEVVTQ